MESSTKPDPKPIRDIAYYQQRYRNRVFSKIASFVTDQCQSRKLTQKDVAERIRKDPAALSRILRGPSNLTLDTISDILLAFDAEAEPPEIIQFKDRSVANFMHPLVARALDIQPAKRGVTKTESANASAKTLNPSGPALKIEIKIEMTSSSGSRHVSG